MATTKTLAPTNQTITLAEFTEKPDNRVNVNNDSKLADAVNALNSNIRTVPHIFTVTVPANGSITITKKDDMLPNAYIATSSPNNGASIVAVIGVGYGAEAVRHKIVDLIPGSSISFAPASDAYGLVISSSVNSDRQIYITPLQLL